VPVIRAIIDITGTPHGRRNDGTPVDYSGSGALRREQCDMTSESWNAGATRDGRC
jgi:hypothetical protein